MTIWKDLTKTEPSTSELETPQGSQPHVETSALPARQPAEARESLIRGGLLIEGKIEGEGNMRIAGNFKGEVRVKGNLIIESGAHITAEISAETVVVGVQVEGNINALTQVKLLESGQLVGDLKAKSLTVAAGSRMRGRVEFGWDEQEIKKVELNVVKKADSRSAL